MDNQNNFVQQPVAPLETPSQKKKISGKMIAIIAAIVAMIIAAIVLIIVLNSGHEELQPETPQSNTETQKKPNKDTVVKEFIASINDEATTYLKKEKQHFVLEQIYDQALPVYKSSSKVAIPLEKSYGLKSPNNVDLDVATKLAKYLEKYLTNNGFKIYDALELTSTSQYLNKETGILCTVAEVAPFSIGCGHIDWITADNTALIDNLAEAYKRVEDEYPLYIAASKKNIKDSPFEPYQKLEVSLPGAAGLFYRPSPTSDWVFFAATQSIISCKRYEADSGARKAFQGEKCYDESTKETRAVTNGT